MQDRYSVKLNKRLSESRRRGFAIMLTALMMVWVIPTVGLVIDVGIMYSIKARLTAACDAAALAAARSLSTGTALLDQEAAAKNRAETFFKANFPDGTLETANRQVDVTVLETEAKVRTIRVTGSAAAPVYFMQMLGSARTVVSSVGEVSRRDVNVMLSLDRSGSLETAGACDDLEDASRAFVGLFANGRDRVGFMTWGASYRVDYPPTRFFKQSPSASEELDKLYPNGCNGYTGSAQGLWKAYEQIVAVSEPGSLNILVFFTDGRPNTVAADWPVKTDGAGPGGPSTCWDWVHNVGSNNGAWNPVDQVYRGWVDPNGRGIYSLNAGPIPAVDNPGMVTIPHGYSGAEKAASADCRYRTWPGKATDDVYYPEKDLYGNKFVTGYKQVNVRTGGQGNGNVKEDDDTARGNAAINAVDDAARRIREKTLNSNVSVVVHVVGLGDVGADQHELLKRIANTADSPIHDSNAPTGLYLFAPTASQLDTAFQKIGSEVLRLSK
ncbi:MAG: VWA domain-containing protein [Bryobacterales bacterium]|nr:VWA domain-containing protein [Bryobacterales bacterium]